MGTSYIARHTFAWTLKLSAIETAVLPQMMGHKPADTTEIYLSQFSEDALDDAVTVLLKLIHPTRGAKITPAYADRGCSLIIGGVWPCAVE
jgi:hypothetical protein